MSCVCVHVLGVVLELLDLASSFVVNVCHVVGGGRRAEKLCVLQGLVRCV